MAGAAATKKLGTAAAAKSGVVPRRVLEREREFWARLPQVGLLFLEPERRLWPGLRTDLAI